MKTLVKFIKRLKELTFYDWLTWNMNTFYSSTLSNMYFIYHLL